MAKIYGIPHTTTTTIAETLPSTTAPETTEPFFDTTNDSFDPSIDENDTEIFKISTLCQTGLKAILEIDGNCFLLSSNYFTECLYQSHVQNFTRISDLWPGIRNISSAFHFQG